MKLAAPTIAINLLTPAVMAVVELAVQDTSGGDYTWRMQAMLRFLQLPMGILAITSVITAIATARIQTPINRRRLWFAGASLLPSPP